MASRTFACDSNDGQNVAVGSFILSQPMPDFFGLEIVIDLMTLDATLPPWWDFAPSPTQCRGAALAVAFDFSALASVNCLDPFGQVATGGIGSYYPGTGSNSNRARLIAVGEIDLATPRALAAGTEYDAFTLVIANTGTIGQGACGGCTSQVVLHVNGVRAAGSGEFSQEYIEGAAQDARISWQGAPLNCDALPAHNMTWGRVKSLYPLTQAPPIRPLRDRGPHARIRFDRLDRPFVTAR